MNIDEVKQTLRGPMIPIITNLNEDRSVDHGATGQNVSFVVRGGVVRGRGVLLAVGAGGDFPTLTVNERKQVAKTIVEAAEAAPVLVGVQDTNPKVCIEMARWAEEIGAYGVQLSPTYYYASSGDDCLRLFEAVHDATRSVGIMIYNTYWEGYNMSPDDVARLAKLPRCVAVKWAQPDGAAYLRGVARFADQMAVVDNQGMAVMNHLLGGTGFVTHLCSIWPEHDLAVWDLLEAGDYREAQRKITAVNWPWLDFRTKLWKRTGSESPVVKAALELCGRPGGPSRLPTRSLNDEERTELRELLSRIGVPGLA
jgi:dihydrodipicolinate synthase/N-acetylneuraminate lyase